VASGTGGYQQCLPWERTGRGAGVRGLVTTLEKLYPTERAAYVFREAFDYPYRQIAEVLQLEEANTRRLVA